MKNTRRRFLKLFGLQAAALGSGIIFAPAVHAKPEKSFRWKMITTWPTNFPGLGTGANHLAKTIESMTAGQIRIKVYGAGELVPAMGVFDAVSRGTAEMGHSVAYYWKGKNEAAQFFGAVPFGFLAGEMNAWLQYGGGQKLWDELYADFNLKPFAAGNTGVQMGGWFNKKVNSVKDLKGLKIRMPGIGGEVLRKLGSTVVTLPGGEIFQSLKTGAIDATEWIGPYNDMAFGFHKAAKYYYWPGWHEPGATLECMINKKSFESLPKDLQLKVQVACQASNDTILAEMTARNHTSLQTLVQREKVQLVKFPDPVLKKLGQTTADVLSEIAKKNTTFKKVHESYRNFRKTALQWNAVADAGYSSARTLSG